MPRKQSEATQIRELKGRLRLAEAAAASWRSQHALVSFQLSEERARHQATTLHLQDLQRALSLLEARK